MRIKNNTSIAFYGAATEGGSFTVSIGYSKFIIPVSVGSTATVIGDTLEAAINAKYPFMASNSKGNVKLI